MKKNRKVLVMIFNCIQSIFFHIKNRKNSNAEEKYVLLPLFGMIGDAILFLDALQGYIEYYSQEKGYHIVVGCRPQVSALLKSIEMDKGIELIKLDRGKMHFDYREFASAVRNLSIHKYELIVNVRARTTLENILIYALPGKRKVVFRNNEDRPSSPIERFFFEHTYTEVYYADYDTEQYGRYGKLLRMLGNTSYVSHVSRLPQIKEEILHERPYCVICPSSSARAKCWPAERFAEVADTLVRDFGLDICITGSNGDGIYSDTVIHFMKEKDSVYDFTGKTTMNGWIELIRGAKLVVSNDSASIHIAAAVLTPSVCIAPQHDGYRFLPYHPDEVLEDDCLPIPIRCEKVNCFDCQLSNSKNKAQADLDCQQSITKNGTFKCIEKITVKDVMDAIQQIMKTIISKEV